MDEIVHNVEELEPADEQHRRRHRTVQLVLLRREGEVDQNPENEPGARLEKELEIEVANSRISRGAHEVVIERLAREPPSLGGRFAVEVENQAEGESENVTDREQRTEVVVEQRRRESSDEHEPQSQSQRGQEADEPVHFVPEPPTIGERLTQRDSPRYECLEQRLERDPRRENHHSLPSWSRNMRRELDDAAPGGRKDHAAVIEGHADPQPIGEQRQQQHQRDVSAEEPGANSGGFDIVVIDQDQRTPRRHTVFGI